MTEKDRAVMTQILEESNDTLREILNGRFKLIESKLDAIKDDTGKTNGRVAEHDRLIRLLEAANLTHVSRCPNTEKLLNLEKMEVSRKAVSTFSKNQLAAIGVIAGIVLTMATILIDILSK